MSAALIVLCTVPDRKAADRIARDLVSRRLAACVNRVGPVRSTYRWKGRICRDPEYLLLIKTTRGRYRPLERRILATHPYETPEVIAVPTSRGSRAYLRWLQGSVG